MTGALTDLTVAETRAGLKAGKFSALEVARAHIAAMEKARALNAFITETPERALKDAQERSIRHIVFEIDTPGGLVDSMKTIIKAILASETPVASFVHPQGARSASAAV